MSAAIEPYVRHLALTRSLPNAFFVRSRDCRLFFTVAGHGVYRLPDRDLPLAPGALVYTPAGATYYPKSDPDAPLLFYTLNFDFDRSHAHIRQVQPPCRAELFSESDILSVHLPSELLIFQKPIFLEHMQDLERDFSELLTERNRQALYSEERVSALLSALLFKMARYASVGRSMIQTVDRVLEYINANPEKPLRNIEIGQALSYHPYYINALVKAHTGKTLHQYVLEVRMRRALQLLMDTRLNIAEIAERTGFENPNHFSTAFRRWSGMRPTDFRRN